MFGPGAEPSAGFLVPVPMDNHQRATVGFADSVSLAAVVDVGHHDVTGLIEAEEDAPLADAQAIPAFQRALQRLDVAAAVSGKPFQGANNTLRVGAVHVGEFALSGRLVDEV